MIPHHHVSPAACIPMRPRTRHGWLRKWMQVSPWFGGVALCLAMIAATGCAHTDRSSTSSLHTAASLLPPQGLPPAESFLRIARSNDTSTAMQILARRMGPARGRGPTVWLVGVSHLGEQSYYSELQQLLDAQSRVLYEGVRPDDTSPAISEKPHLKEDLEEHGGIQSSMAKALGLVFQLSAIDYQRDHFQNSDLSVTEMQKLILHEAQPAAGEHGGATGTSEESEDAGAQFAVLMSALEGDSMFNWIANIALGIVQSSSKLQGMARLMLIEVTGSIGGDFEKLGELNPGLKALLKVLIQARNERVMQDLEQHLKKIGRNPGSVAVFYGAAHMNDMEARVREQFKLVAKEDRWMTAFEVDTRKSGLSPADLKMIRSLVDWQMQELNRKKEP